MVHIGAILAKLLTTKPTIKIEFSDRSTGKTTNKKVAKPKVKQRAGKVVVKAKGDNNIINVFGGVGEPTNAQELAPLRAAYDAKQINFLLEPTKEELTGYRIFEAQSNQKKLIATFAGVLPYHEIALIKTGLYIRYLSDNNQYDEINHLHATMTDYTAEERRIVNLASAGHFSHYLLPTFQELKDQKNGTEVFRKHYANIVQGQSLALFVHRGMSKEAIIKHVEETAVKNIKYGVRNHKIYVHATGESNVEVLQEAFVEIKKTFPSARTKRLARQKPILIVKVPYHDNKLDLTDDTNLAD